MIHKHVSKQKHVDEIFSENNALSGALACFYCEKAHKVFEMDVGENCVEKYEPVYRSGMLGLAICYVS